MLPYHPQTFAQLNEFETAREMLESRKDDVDNLGLIICKHRLNEYVGVSLLHKHFELSERERLVEGFAGDKRCCRATAVFDDSSVTPYMWKVERAPSDGWRYHPLEFLPTNDTRLDFVKLSKPVIDNTEFLAEFASELVASSLTETFGISLLHRQVIRRSDADMLVETTNAGTRELLFSVVPRGSVDPIRLTKTLWAFSGTDESDTQCAHCVHCDHYCTHCDH